MDSLPALLGLRRHFAAVEHAHAVGDAGELVLALVDPEWFGDVPAELLPAVETVFSVAAAGLRRDPELDLADAYAAELDALGGAGRACVDGEFARGLRAYADAWARAGDLLPALLIRVGRVSVVDVLWMLLGPTSGAPGALFPGRAIRIGPPMMRAARRVRLLGDLLDRDRLKVGLWVRLLGDLLGRDRPEEARAVRLRPVWDGGPPQSARLLLLVLTRAVLTAAPPMGAGPAAVS